MTRNRLKRLIIDVDPVDGSMMDVTYHFVDNDKEPFSKTEFHGPTRRAMEMLEAACAEGLLLYAGVQEGLIEDDETARRRAIFELIRGLPNLAVFHEDHKPIAGTVFAASQPEAERLTRVLSHLPRIMRALNNADRLLGVVVSNLDETRDAIKL